MSKVSAAIRETRTSLTTVLRNPNLRRLNLAFAGSAIGDWAYATAILIWAYDVGGVRAVGLWFTVRLVLLTIVTPFASTLVDRLPRRAVMVGADVIRGSIAAIVAVLIWVDAARSGSSASGRWPPSSRRRSDPPWRRSCPPWSTPPRS